MARSDPSHSLGIVVSVYDHLHQRISIGGDAYELVDERDGSESATGFTLSTIGASVRVMNYFELVTALLLQFQSEGWTITHTQPAARA